MLNVIHINNKVSLTVKARQQDQSNHNLHKVCPYRTILDLSIDTATYIPVNIVYCNRNMRPLVRALWFIYILAFCLSYLTII